MMMFGDNKKAAATILAKYDGVGGKQESQAQPEKNIDPDLEGHMAIAEDIYHAIKNESVTGVAKALKAHHDLIKAGMGKDEAEVES